MHPAKEGFSALPFFDEFDLSTVDILLISQYVTVSLLLSPHSVLGIPGCQRVLRHGDGMRKPSDINGGMALSAIQPLLVSCIKETQYNSIHFVFRVPSYVFCIIFSHESLHRAVALIPTDKRLIDVFVA